MGLSNVLYCHGGFLTYEHEADPADVVVSIAAFYQRLCLAESPEFILDLPDYYAFYTYSMFQGRVSG
uniref:Uncharacterized protein n=1 Tax=Candidatus Methanogaster sp. ANME-2c ERB4 TaxID=2759911 RepID=A0A7G9YLT2_9EURY|nr:hypothetical protein OEPDFBKK_00042 [Methanosarcinales archaeon ANME-2c ERB4]